jgi:hypothetical protein
MIAIVVTAFLCGFGLMLGVASAQEVIRFGKWLPTRLHGGDK